MTSDLEKRVAELSRRLGLPGEYVGRVRPLLELAYEEGRADERAAFDDVPVRQPAKKKGEKP